ncbi:MAG TPA: amidase [Acetobacteraceae bacterium]|nr:amidase [Acetobacteraceae bacterium]
MGVMGWDEWARHDATALAALVRTGQVTARELAAQAQEAVERLNPQLNAVIDVFGDVVDNPAVDRPEPEGALHGVPLFLKDLGSGLRGRVQDSGSALMRGTVMTATDPTVENFLRAGLVPLGRSTTPEFGMTFDTTTDYGDGPAVTRNPWNLERTPGGSSGGSAAAVAAGIVPLSMSSDGGGSTRIPASFCGLVGLKASRGRVPQPLVRNEYVTRISIDGVVTRSVRDTAAVYDYLTRIPNGGSFIHMGPPAVSYRQAIQADPAALRIGVSTGRWGRTSATDAQVAARVGDVGTLLETLGHTIEEIDDSTICDWRTLWWAYITQWIGSRATLPALAEERDVGRQELQTLLTPMTWRHCQASERYDKFDIFRMMMANNTVTRQFGALMERYDVLLTPTLAVRVPMANGAYSLLRDEDIDPWVERLADACRYTMPANETGLPAISLPAGFDTDGMPLGVQLHGNFAREDVLLRLAAQIERHRPAWFGAVPPVHVGQG